MKWLETDRYGDENNGKFIIYCNHTDGWEEAREAGGEYAELGFQYTHFDNTSNGATSVTLNEAKEIHRKIGEYIKFMEES